MPGVGTARAGYNVSTSVYQEDPITWNWVVLLDFNDDKCPWLCVCVPCLGTKIDRSKL